MRTVVSVSMDPVMASRLKESSAELGQSFSAHVCELITAGEQMGKGLFSVGVDVEREENEPLRANFGSVEHLVKTDRKSEVKLPPVDEILDDEETTPPDLMTALEESLESIRESSPQKTPAERVYAAVTDTMTSIKDVAETAGVSIEEATETLDYLIDVDGEPIKVKLVAGEWYCWLETSA